MSCECRKQQKERFTNQRNKTFCPRNFSMACVWDVHKFVYQICSDLSKGFSETFFHEKIVSILNKNIINSIMDIFNIWITQWRLMSWWEDELIEGIIQRDESEMMLVLMLMMVKATVTVWLFGFLVLWKIGLSGFLTLYLFLSLSFR